MPDGGWLRKLMELLMNLSDFLFGAGNWLWAEYGLWVVFEGIIGVRQIYDQSVISAVPNVINNNSYYQGGLKFFQNEI